MPPLRRVTSCSPSASARTVTAHSLKAIGIGNREGGDVRSPGRDAAQRPLLHRAPRDASAIVTNGHEFAKCFPHRWYRNRWAVASPRSAGSGQRAHRHAGGAWRNGEGRAAGRSAQRGATARRGERELDGDADVELAVGPAVDEVLGEEVLHGEAADEGVAF